jgi:proline iminopeptidase
MKERRVQSDTVVYPEVAPFMSGMLEVSALHHVYFEQSGAQDGVPVVYLHGGPGAGLEPAMRRCTDPTVYRLIMFDQRGAGRSTPSGEVRENTTWDLVEDIERLRRHLEIDRWIVSGGSWGTALALAYAQRHPSSCRALVLRGVFLGSADEMKWFNGGLRNFYPDVWAETTQHLSAEAREHFPESLDKAILDPDPVVSGPAAVLKSRYEWLSCSVEPDRESIDAELTAEYCIPYQRIGIHYGRHAFFLQPGQLLAGVPAIRSIPCYIINGRLDVVCPPIAAHRLKQAWPEAELQIVPLAGHFSTDAGIHAALVSVMDRVRRVALDAR